MHVCYVAIGVITRVQQYLLFFHAPVCMYSKKWYSHSLTRSLTLRTHHHKPGMLRLCALQCALTPPMSCSMAPVPSSAPAKHSGRPLAHAVRAAMCSALQGLRSRAHEAGPMLGPGLPLLPPEPAFEPYPIAVPMCTPSCHPLLLLVVTAACTDKTRIYVVVTNRCEVKCPINATRNAAGSCGEWHLSQGSHNGTGHACDWLGGGVQCGRALGFNGDQC